MIHLFFVWHLRPVPEWNFPTLPHLQGQKMTISIPARRPTFLQRKRWKAVQEAKGKGLSIRGMDRELGIHWDMVGRYIDAQSPPMCRPSAVFSDPESDTILE